MAIEIYWGSGSPYSWRVLLALEYKRLAYDSHLLQFSKQPKNSEWSGGPGWASTTSISTPRPSGGLS